MTVVDELGPLRYRSPELIGSILGQIYDAGEPVPWLRLVDTLTDGPWPWKTVENVIYDLIAFGAVHVVGRAGDTRTPDRRALKPTALGRAWLDRTILPQPRNETTP